MCQWWSTRFLWSISWASCLPRLVSNWLNWFTLTSYGCLATWYTFCYHLVFHHGYNRPWHCIYGDKLLPQDTENLPRLRFICLVSRIIAIELLVAVIISPFWLFMVNLCPILILGAPCHSYQQVYHCLYYTTNLVLNAVCSLFKKICQLVDQIYDRIQMKFQ